MKSDAEMFAEYMKDLFKACNVSGASPLTFYFKDGSALGAKRMIHYAFGNINNINDPLPE